MLLVVEFVSEVVELVVETWVRLRVLMLGSVDSVERITEVRGSF